MSVTNSSTWASIGDNLLVSFPLVYDENIPSWFKSMSPNMALVSASVMMKANG